MSVHAGLKMAVVKFALSSILKHSDTVTAGAASVTGALPVAFTTETASVCKDNIAQCVKLAENRLSMLHGAARLDMWNFSVEYQNITKEGEACLDNAMNFASNLTHCLAVYCDMRMKLRGKLQVSTEFASIMALLQELDGGERQWGKPGSVAVAAIEGAFEEEPALSLKLRGVFGDPTHVQTMMMLLPSLLSILYL